MSDDQPTEQKRCPNCEEYRRGFVGSHGIVAHLFFDHKMSGEEIRLLLLDAKANGYGVPVGILGDKPLTDGSWYDIVAGPEGGK